MSIPQINEVLAASRRREAAHHSLLTNALCAVVSDAFGKGKGQVQKFLGWLKGL